jgi:hypothetical protein
LNVGMIISWKASCVRFVFLKSMYDTSRSLLIVYWVKLQAVCIHLTPITVQFLWEPTKYRIVFTRTILLGLYKINRRRKVKLIRTIPTFKVNTVLQGGACSVFGAHTNFYLFNFHRSHP